MRVREMLSPKEFEVNYLLLSGAGTVRFLLSPIYIRGRRIAPLDVIEIAKILQQFAIPLHFDFKIWESESSKIMIWYKLLYFFYQNSYRIGKNELIFSSEFGRMSRIRIDDGEGIKDLVDLIRNLYNSGFEYELKKTSKGCIASILNKNVALRDYRFEIEAKTLLNCQASIVSELKNGEDNSEKGWPKGEYKNVEINIVPNSLGWSRITLTIKAKNETYSKHIFLVR